MAMEEFLEKSLQATITQVREYKNKLEVVRTSSDVPSEKGFKIDSIESTIAAMKHSAYRHLIMAISAGNVADPKLAAYNFLYLETL